MYPIVCEIYKDLLFLYATNRGLSLFKAYFQIYIPFKYWTSTVYTFKIGAHTIQASKERKLQKVTIERGGQKVGEKIHPRCKKINKIIIEKSRTFLVGVTPLDTRGLIPMLIL